MSEFDNPEVGQKKAHFLGRFLGILASLCGTIAIVILFVLPVLVVKTKIDGVKAENAMTLAQVFQGNYPMNVTWVILLVLLGTGILAGLVSTVFSSTPKVSEAISAVGALAFLLGVCFLAVGSPLFNNNVEMGWTEIEGYRSTEIGVGSIVGLVFGLFASMLCLVTPFQKKTFSAKEIAEDGMLIAMAFILNLVKIPVAGVDQGGSINFQMLPLLIIALRHGPASGFVCGGLVYGVLTCLTDGYGFACFPFDYLVGFGSVAVMGIFRHFILGKNVKGYDWKAILFIICGGILSTFVRFVGSSVSSMILYGVDFSYAVTYNGIYIPVSGAIAFAALVALHGPLVKINKLFPVVE
ncbi:MAG: energy-coupled thiamine transporter ThiT [Candidatus Enteromonas sp.]|nr:energy-coupled thiamine transporter ThiT [Candidatus Enteromonas sp.]